MSNDTYLVKAAQIGVTNRVRPSRPDYSATTCLGIPQDWAGLSQSPPDC